MLRPTYAKIDLRALGANLQTVRNHLPQGCGIVAMVKADAYGHGAVPVAKKLATLGVTAFGVATVEEGLELRTSSITQPILVMGGLLGVGTPAIIMMLEARLTAVIHSAQVVDALEEAARRSKQRIAVHLKIDTGMGRLGVLPQVLPLVLERVKQCQWLTLEGVMTHLALATDQEYTSQQTGQFQGVVDLVEKTLNTKVIRHIANSTASLRQGSVPFGEQSQWWARPGIALYGSTGGAVPEVQLSPVMSLVSRVALIKWIPPGARVSYAGIFTATRKTRLGVVPIGYADGYPWRLTGKAHVIVRGIDVPVIGRITMDMMMLDLTDVDGASVGDEVILMGRDGEKEVSVDQIAQWAETIPYEILCGISKRMPRVYQE